MKAITVSDRAAGVAGMTLGERPTPHLSENDVLVRVHASGFTPGELTWPGTWTDAAGHDRGPSIPGHEAAGVVAELSVGTTGLGVGQRVVGPTGWARDGSLAEYVAVAARDLAPLPADIDFVTAASLPIAGLTAWQALFVHGRVRAGQVVMIHGAAGGVGSVATQLAREAGAYVIGTGHGRHKSIALDLGAHDFIDLDAGPLDDTVHAHLIFDTIGGAALEQSIGLVHDGETLVTIAQPPARQPVGGGRALYFIVEPDRAQLDEIVQRVRRGTLRTVIGTVASLPDAPATFASAQHRHGKTIIQVAE